jgi:hypothetical protein
LAPYSDQSGHAAVTVPSIESFSCYPLLNDNAGSVMVCPGTDREIFAANLDRTLSRRQ